MAVLQRACETTGVQLPATGTDRVRRSHFHVTAGTKHAADNACTNRRSWVRCRHLCRLPPAAAAAGAQRGGAGGGRCAPQLERHRLTDRVAALLPHVTWRVPSATRSRHVENQPPRGPERAFATGGSAFDAMAAPQEGGGRGKRGIALGSARGGSVAPASSGCERLQSAASRAARRCGNECGFGV